MTLPSDTDANLELLTLHSPPQYGLVSSYSKKKRQFLYLIDLSRAKTITEKKLTYTKRKNQDVSRYVFYLYPALLTHAAESKLQYVCTSEKHNRVRTSWAVHLSYV